MNTLGVQRTLGQTDIRRTWGNDPCTKSDEGGDDGGTGGTSGSGGTDGSGGTGADGSGGTSGTSGGGGTGGGSQGTAAEQKSVSDMEQKVSDDFYRLGLIAITAVLGYDVTQGMIDVALNVLANTQFVSSAQIVTIYNQANPDAPLGPNDIPPAAITVTGPNGTTIYMQEGLPPATLEAKLEEEFWHAVLNQTTKGSGGSDEDNQHDVMCQFGLHTCSGSNFCSEESTHCGCSPTSGLAAALLACSATETGLPSLPRGGGVIDPSPISDPAGASWASCFTPGGLPTVPPGCLALDCADDSLAVFAGDHCVCRKPTSGPLMPPIIRCGAVDCPEDGMSVPTSIGCSCMPFGSTPAFTPADCTLCNRPPSPMQSQCLNQPQICFFQNPL
jgi:hypothetical protein